jgi:biopolymer transport protein ExbB
MNAFNFIAQGDAISQIVAVLLLLMSVASWVVILLKTWVLRRASGDVARSTAAFGSRPRLTRARSRPSFLTILNLFFP